MRLPSHRYLTPIAAAGLLLLAVHAAVCASPVRPTPPDALPSSADAPTLVSAAKARAAASHKNLLLIFSASWCGNCHLLERFLEAPDIHPLIDRNFEVLTLVAGESPKDTRHHDTPGATALMHQLASGGEPGLPFFAMLNPAGEDLASSLRPTGKPGPGENIGYPAVPAEIDWFMTMLRKSASLTPAETNTVHTWLVKHEPR